MTLVKVKVLRSSLYLCAKDGEDVVTIKTEVGGEYEIDEDQALSAEAKGFIEIV